MLSALRSRTHRTALIAAVLLSLVLAQGLGLLHRFAHPERGVAMGAVSHLMAPHAHADTPHTAHWLQALFSGHDQDGSCDLYDQLTHADALWSAPVIVLPALLPLTPAVQHRGWHVAAQAAGFLARGPPAQA